MGIKCPKCNSANPETAAFCADCGTRLDSLGDASISVTKIIVSPATAGSTIAGKYRIIEKLGEGERGIVYKAEDTQLKRNVALKFLPQELTRDKEAKERFILEAQAAAALSHPNICTIHEINEAEGKSFIAMEYVEGQSLRTKVAESPLTVEEALDIVIQVAEGLEKAHGKGIIHRDIKSANIMVTDDSQAKIMDFGLAKVKGGTLLTREGTTLGTVAYMSPEQACGENADHRSDLWSLGVVMYEMLGGRLPFTGDRESSILYSIVHEEPRLLKALRPDVPEEILQILNRTFKKKPEYRYSSAAEMLKDLKKFRESLRAEEIGGLRLRSVLKLMQRPIIWVPALFIVSAIALSLTWFLSRQSKIRWARQELLPQIERILDEKMWLEDGFREALNLAIEAEKYIPKDPKLAELFHECSLNISVKTDPPGAHIFMKPYKTPDAEWEYMGDSPLESIRVAISNVQWKIEKEGYETVLAASSTWDYDFKKQDAIPNNLMRKLDRKEEVPAGMVRIQGREIDSNTYGDFFIDQYEVTNRQYKEFVDDGGYKDQKYWKCSFIKEGKVLSWEEAIQEFVDRTGRPGPATWDAEDYPESQDEYPVTGISWYEAAAYAEYKGKRLPTGIHWDIARGGDDLLLLTFEFFSAFIPLSNFKRKGPESVGMNKGITPFGIFDMAGNVREWCWNETPKGRLIRGGAWNDAFYMFGNQSQAPPFDRSSKNGLRCVLYPEPDKIPKQAFEPAILSTEIDFYEQTPVSDEVFEAYKNQFSYDKTDLNVEVEWRNEDSEDWVQEKITFDASYGGERIIAYLFLPKNTTPPYQTVVYFPGGGSFQMESSKNIENYFEFDYYLSFILKNGRAVIYPVYKGTFERKYAIPANKTHQYTEYIIQLVKDFRRCIDYFETRPDIDTSKLAYYGMSLGARNGPIVLAVEHRLKTSVLVIGGLRDRGFTEVNPINYISHVRIPVLMLNGKYDTNFPYEISVAPMYDLLGTSKTDKLLKLYDTGHFIPREELIRETLAWLDKYLGPVK